MPGLQAERFGRIVGRDAGLARVRGLVDPVPQASLASEGLTNREIGDRLFLSPRTVSSHLYRSYPKLGVAGRLQLRDVIARASMPASAANGPGSETLR
jgi:Bacterial regulatory proteins, luxR family